jgi:hypothetical protein
VLTELEQQLRDSTVRRAPAAQQQHMCQHSSSSCGLIECSRLDQQMKLQAARVPAVPFCDTWCADVWQPLLLLLLTPAGCGGRWHMRLAAVCTAWRGTCPS